MLSRRFRSCNFYRSEAIFVLIASAVASLSAPSAWAITALKQIRVGEGSRVEMDFDGKLKPSQIKTEFFNDVIQISLTDVSVYPAKIFSVSGPDLAKVFAYQYSPKLVRARLTVKGKAEAFKDRVDVQVVGNSISVVLGGVRDHIALTAAQSSRAVSETKAPTAPAPAAAPLNTDEKALLEKVIAQPVPSKEGKESAAASTGRTLTWGKKAEPKTSSSILKIFGMLGIVLGIFLAFALLLKQAKKLTGPGSKRFNSMLGRFVRVKLGHREKMIDVVATHYLGPKKSIAVVRVCGRLLVLGVSNDGINLISQLPDHGAAAVSSESNDDFELDAAPSAGDFNLDQILGASIAQATVQEKKMGSGAMSAGPAQIARPKISPAIHSAAGAYGRSSSGVTSGPAISDQSFSGALEKAAAKPNFKDQIRTRLEGMKQL